MTTMSLARLEDMSLQHWFKGALLPLQWVERITNVPLTYNASKQRFEAEIVWLPNFLSEGRGWVYFDPVGTTNCVSNSVPTTEQSTRIKVYNESGSEINSSHYTVNYLDGAITASGTTTTAQGVPTTIDFVQYYVSLLDAWPGTEPPPPPILAVETSSFRPYPYQIGPGVKGVRKCTIHAFATSSAERDDLLSFAVNALYLRHIPVIDFREGEPLKYDGTFNDSFTGNLLTLSSNDDALLYFDNVKSEEYNYRGDWTELNRWRGKVTFDMYTYREGVNFNVL